MAGDDERFFTRKTLYILLCCFGFGIVLGIPTIIMAIRDRQDDPSGLLIAVGVTAFAAVIVGAGYWAGSLWWDRKSGLMSHAKRTLFVRAFLDRADFADPPQDWA